MIGLKGKYNEIVEKKFNYLKKNDNKVLDVRLLLGIIQIVF